MEPAPTPLVSKARLMYFVDVVSSRYNYHSLAKRKDNLGFITDVLTCEGLTVSSKDKRGATPLLMASSAGATTVVEILIQLGANIHEKDNLGNGLLHYAFSLSSLLGRDDDSYTLSQISFTDEDKKGLVPMVRWALEHGFDINEENALGETPLFGLWLADAAWSLKKLWNLNENLQMAQKHVNASFRLCTENQGNIEHKNSTGFNVYEALEHQHDDIWSVTLKDHSFHAPFVKKILKDSLKENVEVKVKSLKKM